MPRSRAAIVLCLTALAAQASSRSATPPAGFEDRQVVDGTASTGALNPVAIAYEPGSAALFVLERGSGGAVGTARVRRRAPATGVVTTALNLTCVDSVGERGLLGIAVDPDFLLPANRYVYLYYTRAVGAPSTACAVTGVAAGSYNSVVRYHESGGQLSGEQVLLRGPKLGADNHNGGTLRFGIDKTLFISMGDNDTGGDSLPAARNLNDLRGKILRIHRDGSIPSDNPFAGQPGRRGEVWAWGLRNPFRISVDAETGTVYIGDVGERTWEEINRGIAGADYGWPCYEANAPFRTCSPAPANDVKPIYAYGHGSESPPVQGNSVTGGPVYRGTAFPAEYRGRYFFGDYGNRFIRDARIAPDGTLTDVRLFMPDAAWIVDMIVSPGGCLTWVGLLGEGVRDVCYVAGVNSQPQAVAAASPTSGPAPLAVQFDGRGSTDADDDPLTYLWDFGDGTSSNAAAPLKTYATPGAYEAVLTVNDGRGRANSTDVAPPVRIVVGNRAPTGTIATPAAGARYNAGQTISYAGTAIDPEEGTLPASAFSWTIVFHHGEHTHPFLGPIVGVRSGSFTIPTTGEEATDVFYRIELTVHDAGAGASLSHFSYRDVVPNLTSLTVAAAPAGLGLQLAVDQTSNVAPWSKSSVVGFRRTLTAPSPQTVHGATWRFLSWSDSGAAEHVVAAPAVPTTFRASFTCIAGCASDTDGDSVPDPVDNCPVRANANQADFDEDGFGDLCESGALLADADLSGRVDGFDLAALARAFGTRSGDARYDSRIDLTRDGTVDGNDLASLAGVFGDAHAFQAPP